MKKNSSKLIGIIVVVLAGLSVFLFLNGGIKGNIINGYWNEDTGECWSSKDRPPGVPYDSGESEGMFISCCFNLDGRQIDCNDPTNEIGDNVGSSFLAIYGVGEGTGQPGNFYVSHIITVTNEGSVPIDNIWIDSAIWSPSNSFLVDAYSRIIGISSTYATNLPIGTSSDFPTDVIELQKIGGSPGSPKSYNLNMLVKATAFGGELDSSRQVSGTITVEKELIGFNVDIRWGA